MRSSSRRTPRTVLDVMHVRHAQQRGKDSQAEAEVKQEPLESLKRQSASLLSVAAAVLVRLTRRY